MIMIAIKSRQWRHLIGNLLVVHWHPYFLKYLIGLISFSKLHQTKYLKYNTNVFFVYKSIWVVYKLNFVVCFGKKRFNKIRLKKFWIKQNITHKKKFPITTTLNEWFFSSLKGVKYFFENYSFRWMLG